MKVRQWYGKSWKNLGLETHMTSLRGLLGIMRIERMTNCRVKELYGVKGMDEIIDKSAIQWSGHIERMKKNRIAKRMYVRECVGTRSVG